MLLQMGPFHALKGKVEHNDEKTDVAKAHWDEIISKGAISCLIQNILGWSKTLCVRPEVDIRLVELVCAALFEIPLPPCPQTHSKKLILNFTAHFLNTETQQKMLEALALNKAVIFKIKKSTTVIL